MAIFVVVLAKMKTSPFPGLKLLGCRVGQSWSGPVKYEEPRCTDLIR